MEGGGEDEAVEEEEQPGGFYLESHPLARHCSIIVASLFCLCQSHAHAPPTLRLRARAPRPPAQLDGQALRACVN